MSGAQPLSFVPTLPPEEAARAGLYGVIARLFYAPPDEQLISELQLASVNRRLAELKSRVQRLNPVTHKDDYLALAGELFSLEQHARALREQAIGGL